MRIGMCELSLSPYLAKKIKQGSIGLVVRFFVANEKRSERNRHTALRKSLLTVLLEDAIVQINEKVNNGAWADKPS